MSTISDTGIITQAMFYQRVAAMAVDQRNRCVPAGVLAATDRAVSGPLLNAGRDNLRDISRDTASVLKSNRVVYLGNSSR
mgnify:CR=1 FL=1